MANQAQSAISVLVAFRDRETERVGRFLSGMDCQTFKDFELVFVDYGSEPCLAGKVKEIVCARSFARYVYNDTRGMAWNRAHALNSGARICRGRTLVCTDVDLIYSKDVLARISEASLDNVVGFGQFQLLPAGFGNWASLAGGSIRSYPRSSRQTFGAITVVSREACHRIRGFDEFFRIWGVEDFDFKRRLELAGCRTAWFDLPPVYHQWHRKSSAPEMPEGWLETMNLHAMANTGPVAPNPEDWGRLLGAVDRPSLAADLGSKDIRRITLPLWTQSGPRWCQVRMPRINAWAKIDFIRQLAGALAEARSGEVVVFEVSRPAGLWIWKVLSRTLLRGLCPKVAGRRYFDTWRESLDVLWNTIVFSGLVLDYSVEVGPRRMTCVLVRK